MAFEGETDRSRRAFARYADFYPKILTRMAVRRVRHMFRQEEYDGFSEAPVLLFRGVEEVQARIVVLSYRNQPAVFRF